MKAWLQQLTCGTTGGWPCNHLDAVLGEQLFDVAMTEGETVIQPDRVADDLGPETVASEGDAGAAERDTGRSYASWHLNLCPQLKRSPGQSTCQCRRRSPRSSSTFRRRRGTGHLGKLEGSNGTQHGGPSLWAGAQQQSTA